MGSRRPREHSIPKAPKPPSQPGQTEHGGLRMENISTFIGLSIFPVALCSAGIAYTANQDSRVVGSALILTVIFAAIAILIARSRQEWLRATVMTNELLLGMLIGVIATAFLIGGIAGLAPAWIVAGVVTLVIAIFVARFGNR